jgi:transcriptional regulator with XRE-family HTH domain
MESVSEESLIKETEIVASPPANFGELLRRRREEAGLSVADLARKTGVVRTTIHNIEQGLTSASPQTLKLLASVKALRLTELDNSRDGSLEAWFTEQYNPMQMVRGMGAVLNGPGGQIEQTLLYLDPQSAFDWYALSNSEQYITAFRSKIPLDKLAERIFKESKGVGLDVDGLGCGDGKTETALMQLLADQMPAPPDLQLYLLDISHVLLSEAYRTALDSLAPRRIPVFAIHGNFNDVSKNPLLYMHPRSIRRLRLFLMMGYTLGNISDEPWFFRDLAACAQPGDLAVLDFQLARAPADQPEKIRELDPPIRAKRPVASYTDFLSGPLRRHCRGLQGIRLRTELSTHCPVPGSYALENWAAVEKEDEPLRQFLVWRIKRYDLEKLSECLRSLGWNTLHAWKYGPEKLAAVLLIQRQ